MHIFLLLVIREIKGQKQQQSQKLKIRVFIRTERVVKTNVNNIDFLLLSHFFSLSKRSVAAPK